MVGLCLNKGLRRSVVSLSGKKSHQGSTAKAKAPKQFDTRTLKAMAKKLPPDAQKDDYDGCAKSYTLRKEELDTSIGVLVDKEAFYVCPVEKLPARYADVVKINQQETFFTHGYHTSFGFSQHYNGRALPRLEVCNARALLDQRFAAVGVCLTRGLHWPDQRLDFV